MIELGVRAKDRVTAFEGIITGRAQYIYGCDQYVLVPPVDKNGKIVDGQWFDEGRIIVLGAGVAAEEVSIPNKPGGPQRDAPRA